MSNQKKKSGRRSSNVKRKAKRKARSSEEDDEEEFLPEELEVDLVGVDNTTAAGSSNHSAFWAWMEQYFVPLTTDHRKLLEPVQAAQLQADPAFSIPAPGRAGASGADEGMGGDASSPTRSGDSVYCGDLTQRILAALVQEKLLSGSSRDALTRTGREGMSGGRRGSLVAAPGELVFKASEMELSPAQAPTADYSDALMLTLEDRIRSELTEIGLIDPSSTSGSAGGREDDEICQELRQLQSKLRGYIRDNSTRKAELYPACVAEVERQASLRLDQQRRAAIQEQWVAYRRRKAKEAAAAAAAAAASTEGVGGTTDGQKKRKKND